MSEPGPVRRFFGGALMAIGGVLAALSGTCTAIGLMFGIGNAEMAVWAIVVGALPIAIGLGLYVTGKALWGGNSAKPTLPPANFSETNGDAP